MPPILGKLTDPVTSRRISVVVELTPCQMDRLLALMERDSNSLQEQIGSAIQQHLVGTDEDIELASARVS